MGSKVHPTGFRVGISQPWKSTWFNENKYREYLHEDRKIREYVEDKYQRAGVSEVIISRPSDSMVKLEIFASRVGIIIGKKGSEIQKLREELSKLVNERAVKVFVQEVRNPYSSAKLIAEDVSNQLLRRISHKVAMKRAINNAMKRGVKGIKIMVSGRLGGADIARTETYMEGRLPLQTLKANLDYSTTEAQTKYGTTGIKVWIYKGDVQL